MRAIISPDHYLINSQGLYEWSPERARVAWACSYKALELLAEDGFHDHVVLMVGVPGSGKTTWINNLSNDDGEYTIFWDACFPDHRSRTPVISRAKELGFTVGMVWLSTPLEICIERNNKRSPDRRVPLTTLQSMHDRLQQFPPDVLTDKVSYITKVEYKP